MKNRQKNIENIISQPFMDKQKRHQNDVFFTLELVTGNSPIRGNVALRQKGCRPLLRD